MGEERKKKGRKDFISQEMITEMMFFFLKKNFSQPIFTRSLFEHIFTSYLYFIFNDNYDDILREIT